MSEGTLSAGTVSISVRPNTKGFSALLAGALHGEAGNWNKMGVMTYSDDASARRELYGAFRQRGYPKNIEVLASILRVRRELATLLGYKDWADYITETRMMKSGAAAATFIERIATIAKPAAERELAMLLARKTQDGGGASEVGEWERGYYDEKVKRDSFAFNAQSVRPYFEYERVKAGVLATCAALFGVRFVRVQN